MNADSPAPFAFGSRRGAEWQIALWSIFLVAFAGAGALPLRSIALRDRVLKQGAGSSTDTVFERDLLLEDATSKIAGLLAAVPTDAKVAVVWRVNSADGLPVCLIHQLAWPRPVSHIDIPRPPEGSDALAESIRASGAKAVFFVRATPPPFPQTMEMSPFVQFWRLP